MEENEKSNLVERAYFPAMELRVSDGKGGRRIEGYAAIFNSMSQNLGGFVERIAPGAFTDALKKSDARALWNHNRDWVLGRESARTLRLWQDTRGLGMEIFPPDTTWAKDLMVSMERGDVKETSFGFIVAPKGDTWDIINQENVRTVIKVDELWDVSPVTFPAYPATEVYLRAIGKDLGVDIDALAAILVRVRHGLVLTDTDRLFLASVPDKVLHFVDTARPMPGVSDNDPAPMQRDDAAKVLLDGFEKLKTKIAK